MTEDVGANPPKLVGKYTLLRELGSREVPTYAAHFAPEAGEATLVVLERYVTEEPSDGDETLAQAAREAEPLTSLAHANVAGVRAVMATGTDVIVASELVDGETYADLTKSKDPEARLPFRARLRVMLDVLAGLGAIHEVVHGTRNRVHGDLAPDNVIVGVDGRARLVRVCNLFPEQASPASPTLCFIAPELVQGAAGTALVDARVDLYSAGVLLWEVLTGKRLMVQTNSSALLLYELDRPPRGIPADDLPWAKHLIDVVKRALAPAAERWSSAAEMAAAITAIAGDNVASAEEVGAVVTRIAGEKISARRGQLASLEPRPADEARPSITAKNGVRAPRAIPIPPPVAPTPSPAPTKQGTPARLAPRDADRDREPPVAAPAIATVASAVAVPPATPSSPLRNEDLSASIVFPLHRKRRTVTWAIAGGASLLVVIGIVHFATKRPATATTATVTQGSTAPTSLVPPEVASDTADPAGSGAAIDIELPETTGPSGHRVRKRRRPPTAPSSTVKKKFDPQGI
ncbi:MAG: hypothetical protein JWM74_1355 [Myxococcaceae bacterium]|nr:hypothetical protein [Myxococcaceae bacterium]